MDPLFVLLAGGGSGLAALDGAPHRRDDAGHDLVDYDSHDPRAHEGESGLQKRVQHCFLLIVGGSLYDVIILRIYG